MSSLSRTFPWPGVIRRYAEFLPVTDATPVVTLLEGSTPLIPVPNFVKDKPVMIRVESFE